MTSLIPRDPRGGIIEYGTTELETMRATIAKDCDDQQFGLFLQVVRQTGLNPFDRQIYPVVRNHKLTIQTGIDGYRLQAQRTGEYGGSETEWCGQDGIWVDVWLKDEYPFAARTTVYRNGNRYVHVARWSEFVQKFNNQVADMWKKMPANQLGKCSEAGALRRAFPAELSGVFVDAEAGAIDHVYDAEAQRDRPAPRQIQQPRSKSAAKARPQPEEKPFGAEEEEPPIEGETTELPPAAASPDAAPWGRFWNELTKAMDGVPLTEIGKALGIEPTLKSLQAWYSGNGASLELVDFVVDQVNAAKGD